MKENLKKIKETLEKSIEDSERRDIYIGQAIGMLDILISGADTPGTYDAPKIVQQQFQSSETMMDAVERHKQVHTELSKDAVSKQNTQFEQLK